MSILALSLTWWLFALCLTMGLGAWFIFVWGVRGGMFRDPEEIADRLLEMDRAQTTDQSPIHARVADPISGIDGDSDSDPDGDRGGGDGPDAPDSAPRPSGEHQSAESQPVEPQRVS